MATPTLVQALELQGVPSITHSSNGSLAGFAIGTLHLATSRVVHKSKTCRSERIFSSCQARLKSHLLQLVDPVKCILHKKYLEKLPSQQKTVLLEE